MNLTELNLYIEALSSCAIEGDRYAIKLLNLRKTAPQRFLSEISKMHEKETLEGGKACGK